MESNRSFLFYVWPRIATRHPWRVVFAALAVFITLILLSRSLKGSLSDAFSLPNSESQRAFEVLKQRFPQSAGDSATVVVEVPDGVAGARRRVEGLITKLKALPEVVSVSNPFEETGAISKDGNIARITVQYDRQATKVDLSSAKALANLRKQESQAGFTVEVGGPIIMKAERGGFGSATLVGVIAAIVVLLIAFGSVVAMGLPILTAFLALGSGLLLISISARFFTMPSFTPEFGAMIGLGVGIDYALLVVTRFRESMAAGMDVETSVTTAAATAGRSVLFAGSTVIIAMLGLWLVGIPFVAYLGTAAAIIVAMAVVVAVFVLPAVLRLIGARVDSLRVPGIRPVAGESEKGFGYSLSRAIQRSPWVSMSLSLGLLLLLAAPVLSLRIGSSDAGNNSTKQTTRRAYDLLSQGFGPGFNGTVLVTLEINDAAAVSQVQALPQALASMPGVAKASPARFNADNTAATIAITPSSSPQSVATKDLVHQLRDNLRRDLRGSGATPYVGGSTAAFIDIGDTINSRLPFFFAAVIGLSFVLLAVVFRSVVIAVQAALMNVLAIGASFGALVAVFQWGWFSGVFGVKAGPIESFLPMFLFAVLFGLSMDYEVFLVGRIHEEYLRVKDNSEAVARGLSVTTRLITAAAAIMVCVFLSFAFGDNRTIKEFGIGLSTAIFVDATLIRLVLVPSLMQLLGEANWWFPPFLDRRLPRFHVDPHWELEPSPMAVGGHGHD
jgi:RND superfamily putative drug exporter